MAGIRSRRRKLLDGMCRNLCDRLHERVAEAARARGQVKPEDTSSVYALALCTAPGLLDQLIAVFRLVDGERERERPAPVCSRVGLAASDGERRQMLSAVRATVGRSRLRGRLA